MVLTRLWINLNSIQNGGRLYNLKIDGARQRSRAFLPYRLSPLNLRDPARPNTHKKVEAQETRIARPSHLTGYACFQSVLVNATSLSGTTKWRGDFPLVELSSNPTPYDLSWNRQEVFEPTTGRTPLHVIFDWKIIFRIFVMCSE